jgi:DNA-binding transcriptional regulator YiaG
MRAKATVVDEDAIPKFWCRHGASRHIKLTHFFTHVMPEHETRRRLLRMRRKYRISRTILGLILSLPPDTLRRWETGDRRPSCAARKLIWLVDCLLSGSPPINLSELIAGHIPDCKLWRDPADASDSVTTGLPGFGAFTGGASPMKFMNAREDHS